MSEQSEEFGGVLEAVASLVEADPRSGQSLLFYALLKTLDTEQGGHMYMLRKLRELSPENRRLAYGLMELMAQEANCGATWEDTLARVDEAIRGRRYQ
ncbi:MAG TPA: hypothetical protein VKA50_13565 [Gammaproteobacteria bacterium]|nr:hypothetical protein [Gammaproteobacteria bacterium]